MKTINVDYLPPKEALELLEWQAEKEKFNMCTRESELEFIIHYRNSPYRKWLNTSSNTSDWKKFCYFSDKQGNLLKINYHQIERCSRDRRNTYEIDLSYRKAQLRHWIVDRVFEMIEQPDIAKELSTKLIAWRKSREMLLNTTRSAVEMAIIGHGKISHIDYRCSECNDWGKEKHEIDIRISTIANENIDVRIHHLQVPAFVKQLPNILSDLQMLQQIKRGKKLDYYHSTQWMIA